MADNERGGIEGFLELIRSAERQGVSVTQVIGPIGVLSSEAVGTPAIVGGVSASLGPLTLKAEGIVGDRNVELLLGADILRLGERVDDGEIVEAVLIPLFSIARELRTDPDFLYRLTPRKFEEVVAALYMESGFDDVVLTPRSGDGGKDIVATKHGRFSVRVLDQVKRYAPGTVVTADEVRALVGVLSRDRRATMAYVTTTSTFAPGVWNEFEDMMPERLNLRDGAAVREWLIELAYSRRH